MGTCRSCGAAVRWAVSSAGRPVPVDYEPDPRGILVLVEEDSPDQEIAGRMRAIHVTSYERINGPLPLGEPRYTSHFATCPNADQHRSAGARGARKPPAVERRRSGA